MSQIISFAQKGLVLAPTNTKVLVSKYLTSKYLPKKLINKFCLPGGQINFGEQPDNSFVNEIKEETGIVIIPLAPFYIWTWIYKKEGVEKQIIAVARLGYFKSGEIAPPPEEKETTMEKAKWLSFSEVKKQLAKFVVGEDEVIKNFFEHKYVQPK